MDIEDKKIVLTEIARLSRAEISALTVEDMYDIINRAKARERRKDARARRAVSRAAYEEQRYAVRSKRESRKRAFDIMREMGLPYVYPEKMSYIMTAFLKMGKWDSFRKLMTTDKFRSDFRRSLAEQVREWAKSKQWRHKSMPLTEKQLKYL